MKMQVNHDYYNRSGTTSTHQLVLWKKILKQVSIDISLRHNSIVIFPRGCLQGWSDLRDIADMTMFQLLLIYSVVFLSLTYHASTAFQLPSDRSSVLIIDAIVANAGVDMLQFRMLELQSVVDYFLIIESNVSDISKSYHGNIDLFKAYSHQVIAVTVGASTLESHFDSVAGVLAELEGLQPQDIIIISQAEEIPRLSILSQLKSDGVAMPYRLSLVHFTYCLACQHSTDWRLAFLSDYKTLIHMLDLGQSADSSMDSVPSALTTSVFSLRQGTTRGGDVIPRSLVRGGWFLNRFGDIDHFVTPVTKGSDTSPSGEASRLHCAPHATYYMDLPIHLEKMLRNGWGDAGLHVLRPLQLPTRSRPPTIDANAGTSVVGPENYAQTPALISVFPRTTRVIVDCIIYAATPTRPRPTVEMLLLRLAELRDIVDFFVLVDGQADPAGETADWVSERAEELKNFWEKVIYVPAGYVVHSAGASRGGDASGTINSTGLPTGLELAAARLGVARVHGLRVDDIVLVSRADELPSIEVLNGARLNGLGSGISGGAVGPAECGYRLQMSYYFGHLNCRMDGVWERAVIFHYYSFKKWVDNPLSVAFRTQPSGGWYLSGVGAPSLVPAEMMGLCINDLDDVDVHSLPQQFDRMVELGWLRDTKSRYQQQRGKMISYNYLEQSLKPLYYFGDEKYLPMKEFFVSSVMDTDIEHHFHLLSSQNQTAIPTDNTKITGAETWIFKNRYIIDAIRSNMGRIILFSDIDMQYFKPVAPLIDECMRSNEMCFQRETLHYGFINTGFMAIMCNENTLQFWNKVLEILLETRRQKQAIVYHLVYFLKYDIRWAVFPATVWSWHFAPLHRGVAVHHASFVVGMENKFQQLRYARLFMLYAPHRENYFKNATEARVQRHVYVL